MFIRVRKDRATQCHTHVFNPIRVVDIPPLIILSSRTALHLRYTHIVVVHIALVGKIVLVYEVVHTPASRGASPLTAGAL